MTIAYVGEAGIGGQSLDSPQEIPYDSADGNTLVVTGHFYNAGDNSCFPTSITDDADNDWLFATANSQLPPAWGGDVSDGFMVDFVAWCVGAAPVTGVTLARQDGGTVWWRCALSEWSGIVQVDTAWAGGFAIGQGTASFDLGPVNLSVPGELVVGNCDFDGSGDATIPDGWTELTSEGGQVAGYYLAGALTGSYSPVWTTTGGGQTGTTAALAVFSPVALDGGVSGLMMATMP